MTRRPIPAAAFALAAVALAVTAPARPPKADRAFDELVPPAEVRDALLKLDPSALAGVAAKAAAAEKKLGRARPEVSAAQFYEITIRVAGERKAVAVLERVAEAELVKADGRLTTLVRATRLAVVTSRGGDADAVAINESTAEQFNTLRAYLTQIQDAKALADPEAFDRLSKYIDGVQELTGPQKKYLAREIAKAAASLPKTPPPAAVVAVRQARDRAAKEAAKEDAETERDVPPPVPAQKGQPTTMPPATPAPAAPPAGGNGGSGGSPSTLAGKLAGDTSALVDEGFEGRIDLARIGKAWARGDAVALADHAFRMAEEERSLRRPHRHVPAKALFQASFGLAIANSDAATIARLEKGLKGEQAPDFEGKDEFLVRLNTSKSLVASSRKGKQPFFASIDRTAPESFRAFRSYLDRIHAAAARRDTATLTGLTEGLDTVIELDDAQRAYLRREAAETGPAPPPATAGNLRALEAASVPADLLPLNAKVLAFCKDKVGRAVDDGSAELLALRAAESAGARAYFPSGADAVPIWGKEVRPADARPGDVVQFRDAVLTFTHPDGRTQSSGYPRHTAVIAEVDGPGRFVVLQQNVGPAGKDEKKRKLVQLGWLDLTNLKQPGTAVIYRPQPR
jgi:hypothetical protein